MAYVSSTQDRYRGRARSEAFTSSAYAPAYGGWAHHPPTITEQPELPAPGSQLEESAETEEGLLDRYIPDKNRMNLNELEDRGQICMSRSKGFEVLVKRVPRSRPQDYLVAKREITARLAVLDPCILTIVDWLDVDNAIWSVVEYRKSNTLKQVIESQGVFPHAIIKSFLNQLLSGIASLFMAGYAHLRLCDETVYMDIGGKFYIGNLEYICEYGLERTGDAYAPTSDKYAADIYVAPEVYASKTYNARKATMWSVGILTYFITTGQTEKLSNIGHPSFELTTPFAHPSSVSPSTSASNLGPSSTARRVSEAVSRTRIILYPNRFSAPSYIRSIIPRMLVDNPRKRAELIEIATRVPKEYDSKLSRPLMDMAYLDYKHNVGPNADLHNPDENVESGASSIFGAASNFSNITGLSGLSSISNPFRSLLGNKSHSRRKSEPVYTSYVHK